MADSGKQIPQVNLSPALRETAKAWRAGMRRLFARSHFILGQELRNFEEEFARASGAAHMIGVGSGTAALELCLRDAAVRGEVLTSALSAPFTAVGICAAGCTPRFADIDPDTLQIDPGDAADRVTARTRALVPVHLYGQTCDLTRLRKLGLPIIQDACQAHGARFKGKPLTAYSTYVAYSFYPTKNLGCLGDGGAIATDNNAAAARLKSARDGGRRGDQISHSAGINSRLDELQCCFLRAFLPHLTEWNNQRARIAAIYDEQLAGCPGVRLLLRTADCVHHLYVIRAERRDRLRSYLAAQGIGSAIHYPVPLHHHPAFAQRVRLPNAESAVKEIVSLPIWPHLSDRVARRIADCVRKFYRR